MDEFKEIEKLLKDYNHYKVGIQNMQKQLRYYFPTITSASEFREGTSGTFTYHSSTEEYGIKRVEKAIEIQEEIDQYRMILESVDAALKQLEPIEQEIVNMMYFQKLKVREIAKSKSYSSRTIYAIRDKVKKQLLISLKYLVHIENNP